MGHLVSPRTALYCTDTRQKHTHCRLMTERSRPHYQYADGVGYSYHWVCLALCGSPLMMAWLDACYESIVTISLGIGSSVELHRVA